MTILNETYTLANDVSIPKLGLGTWFIDDDKAAQAVRDAVEIGYRNIDTAQAYGNERGVGDGPSLCAVLGVHQVEERLTAGSGAY
jgi:diketogulonate reductase-like aldo/keto reductase